MVEGDASTICCKDVRDVYPTFMGSNLFLADIPVVCTCIHACMYTQYYISIVNTPDITYTCMFMQVWTEEQVQSLVYTTKQINTIPEKTVCTFNVALISTSLSKIDELKSCLLKCYEHVSVCYWQTACRGN